MTMSGIRTASSFNFMEVSKDEKCPIHHENMLVAPNGQTICWTCQKEHVLAKERNEVMANQPNMVVLEDRSYWPMTIKKRVKRGLPYPSFEISQNKSEEAKINGEKAKNMAKNYLNIDFVGNTIITGPAGRGKSWNAACILREVAKNSHQECLFIDWANWTDDYNEARQKGYDLKTSYERIVNADLVVLDDIGAEIGLNYGQKDNLTDRLYKILNNRERTIITTNLTSKELMENYQNGRMISRMMLGMKDENGVVKPDQIIKFTGQSTDLRSYGF